jgi:hypothetical protein
MRTETEAQSLTYLTETSKGKGIEYNLAKEKILGILSIMYGLSKRRKIIPQKY